VCEDDVIEEDNYSRLLNASRDVRIAATEYFDELLNKLKSEAIKKLASVERAKKLAAQ